MNNIGVQENMSNEVNEPFTKSIRRLRMEITSNLSGNAFAVYLHILSFRNTNTNQCNPSYYTISKELTMSVSTVKRYVNQLESAGYLIINSGNFKKRISNNYYFPKESFFNPNGFSEVNATRIKMTDEEKIKLSYNIEKNIPESKIEEINKEKEEKRKKQELFQEYLTKQKEYREKETERHVGFVKIKKNTEENEEENKGKNESESLNESNSGNESINEKNEVKK